MSARANLSNDGVDRYQSSIDFLIYSSDVLLQESCDHVSAGGRERCTPYHNCGPVADERCSDRPIQGLQYCSVEGYVFIRAGVAGCRDGGRVRGRTIIIGTRQIAALAHSL